VASTQPGTLTAAPLLSPPEFRRFHGFVKWALIVLMVAMIIEGSFFFIYILIRFGWS
jgi:hypothetical protein